MTVLDDVERAVETWPKIEAGLAHRIRTDPAFRAQLELCDRWGIPHSHFLGEPLCWGPLDRAKALLYRQWRLDLCEKCRTSLAEWDPQQGGHRNAYIGDTIRCPGCERIETTIDQIPAEEKGVKAILTPRELVPDAWDDQ